MGRISTYTQEKADKICEKLSRGIPLAVICREDAAMPAVRTVSLWKKDHPEFAAAFARAREDGFDALAAQCLEIADNESHDWEMTQKGVVTSEVAIGRARLQVDTRLKLLAKWDPSRYGDKTAMELTNPDGSLSPLTDTERAAKVAAILAAAKQRADGDAGNSV